MLNPTDSSTKKHRELSSEEKKMVVFLIDRRLGLPQNAFRKYDGRGLHMKLRQCGERNRFWDEFASLSPEELRKRYDNERDIFDGHDAGQTKATGSG